MGVSVRHNSRLAALVATVAAVMTVAWFSRALQSGSVMDWVWCVAMAGVAFLQLLVIRDGRVPAGKPDLLGPYGEDARLTDDGLRRLTTEQVAGSHEPGNERRRRVLVDIGR